MDNSQLSSLSIFQAISLVIMLIIIYSVTSHIFSFIESSTLSALLAGILRIIIFIAFIIKREFMDKEQFQIKKMSGIVLLLGCITIHLATFLPVPQINLSWIDETTQFNVLKSYIANNDTYDFLNMCIAVPIAEELFFRGIILGGLSRCYSPIIALCISSLMFGIFHFNIIGATITGLFLGWVYLRTQNILYGILMHSSINLAGTILRSLLKNGYMEDIYNNLSQYSKMNLWIESIWVKIVCSMLFIACTFGLHVLFKRKMNKHEKKPANIN